MSDPRTSADLPPLPCGCYTVIVAGVVEGRLCDYHGPRIAKLEAEHRARAKREGWEP